MDPRQEIHPAVMAQLEALTLDPARPLLAVDADEVLVVFAAHLAEYVAGLGFEMRLTQYRLEGAIRRRDTGEAVPFDESLGLIDRYFTDEAERQAPIPGAAEALARLSHQAQVVVLTNVPRHAREARIAHLARLGMGYPLVENAGGKGPALAWMAARAGTPVAFIDDSPAQIASVAQHLPDCLRLHFAGSAFVSRIVPRCEEADARVADWEEAERLLGAHFAAADGAP